MVNNASQDRTCDEVLNRGVPLLANSHNAGFAAAVNQGVRATTAPFVLLLNPDASLERGWTPIAEFEDPKVGAAGGLLVGTTAYLKPVSWHEIYPRRRRSILEVLGVNALWPGNPVNWHYRCLGLDPVTPGLVEQPAGAFLMFSREIWERVGGFDERFWPIWFEDVDFCAA